MESIKLALAGQTHTKENRMKKTVDTVVEDVYEVVKTRKAAEGVNVAEIFAIFNKNVGELVYENLLTQRQDNTNLRMSSIGKPDRQIWLKSKGTEAEELAPSTLIKFLFGHIIEELVLLMVRLSGHEVTHEQERVNINGVSGSMDCCIDGTLIDVKSASSFAFKKFKENTVEFDDPFGYVDQLKGYGAALKQDRAGWLAMDKGNGHLALAMIDLTQGQKIEDRIEHIKAVVADTDTMPDPCYDPVPDGKSGNMKLPTGCSYCSYKKTCYPKLRTFIYSSGPRYLTEVWKLPNVLEVKD